MTNPYESTGPIETNSPSPAPSSPETRDLAVPGETTEPAAPSDDVREEPKPKVKGSLAGGTWVALIFGTLLLILLLIFIMQNQTNVELDLFAWSFTVPVGVGFLLAAITGALIMAIVGGVRMLELRRQVRRARKALR
ncbi:LapA family protein [Corynebacterium epidermidicanis]|uniref:Putative integral membrane protein n=1 Tax=Corynebacterium epidermidicanis TaxID=1050174 RepID=A0A0G3GS61_9CORY|nr:lipopolysaccharide assembly protein LapA domain-containing protein [Corynebacterium epidermidicanis]AKK03410.1 putative integral membrane protein [Corynebacterium epidermidicanis]